MGWRISTADHGCRRVRADRCLVSELRMTSTSSTATATFFRSAESCNVSGRLEDKTIFNYVLAILLLLLRHSFHANVCLQWEIDIL